MTYSVLSAEPACTGGEISVVLQLTDGRYSQKIKGTVSLEFYKELGFPTEFFIPVAVDEFTFKNVEFLMRKTEAIKKGLDLLGYSQNTKKSLSEKLRQRGFDRECAEQASLYLSEKGFINEKDSALELAQDMALRGKYGRMRITHSLYEKGFEREAADYALSELEVDFPQICADRISMMGGADIFGERTSRIKAMSALARYGFSFDDIKLALKYLNGQQDE